MAGAEIVEFSDDSTTALAELHGLCSALRQCVPAAGDERVAGGSCPATGLRHQFGDVAGHLRCGERRPADRGLAEDDVSAGLEAHTR